MGEGSRVGDKERERPILSKKTGSSPRQLKATEPKATKDVRPLLEGFSQIPRAKYPFQDPEGTWG